MTDPTSLEGLWRADPSTERLESNLAAVAAYDADLAARIRAAPETSIDIETTEDGGATAVWKGRRLASGRGSRREASALVDTVDPEDTAVVAVVGFGLGLHVGLLASRFRDTGVLIVYEPDLELLRAVFARVEPGLWTWGATIRVTDRLDVSHVSRLLRGFEALAMIGTTILEHPPSRARLGDAARRWSTSLREVAANTRMTMNTTLLRCLNTLENQLGNLERYAFGSGIDDLRNAASGRLGVVVSAGPSLQRNIAALTTPGVRDRCVIVATQTTLKPLLARGVSPHYVVALDYHEISQRFYEGLDPALLERTELVIDAKVNPAVPAIFPGRIRTIPSPPLDRILARESDPHRIPAASTVAHLAYGLARHLGCDPVAFIGQDLGFTDGLYYAPGNAIHDVWAPEFNDFNTVETMEWERIARHRALLSAREDVHGRRIFTDAQMLSYLRSLEVQFEADRDAGLRIVDATEGGLGKRFTERRSLAETVSAHAPDGVRIELPVARVPDRGAETELVERLGSISNEAAELERCSREAAAILGEMVEHQRDDGRMRSCFARLDDVRGRVSELGDAPKLADSINQLGAFQRLRADRRIRLREGGDAVELQRRELDRDLVNVTETARAATVLAGMLDATRSRIEASTPWTPTPAANAMAVTADPGATRVVAVVPIDPDRGGTGVARRLEATFGDVPVLQRTLERLGTSEELVEIVLLAPDGLDVDRLIDRSRVGLPVRIERCDGAVFPPEHEAVRIARAAHPTSWRGGLQGLTVYDEVFAPRAARVALAGRGVTGAVFVGPDWPLVTVHGEAGIDALVRRHRDDDGSLLFVHAPPGLGAALVPLDVVESVAARVDRGASIGAWLGYLPNRPVGDPISGPGCLVPEAGVRNALGRYTFDSPRQIARMRHCFEDELKHGDRRLTPLRVARRMEERILGGPLLGPQFVRIELCTGRRGARVGLPFAGEIQRAPMDVATFRRIIDRLGDSGDTILTLDGLGDPLLHPRFDEFAAMAIDAGVRVVRVRTDLAVEPAVVDRLVAAPIAIVDVDLGAESRAVYERVHGVDMYELVGRNLEHLIESRRLLGGRDATRARGYGLPWIVPRIERRSETIGEIPEFFERWRRRLGVAVIDPAMSWPEHVGLPSDGLLGTWPPDRHRRFVAATRLTVLADGSVPVDEGDLTGIESIGRVQDRPLRELWRAVTDRRREDGERLGETCPSMRV